MGVIGFAASSPMAALRLCFIVFAAVMRICAQCGFAHAMDAITTDSSLTAAVCLAANASTSANGGGPGLIKRLSVWFAGGHAEASHAADRLSIRIDLASGSKIGPGKVAVLEQIARTGSISAAGRTLKLSYRRTWDLIDDLNRGLGAPVIETAIGATAGGGAVLTEVGKAVVTR
jgi:molybdate transport system regulatory protein